MKYYLINDICISNDKYYLIEYLNIIFIKIFTIFILLFPFYLLFLYILEKTKIYKLSINNKIKENINKRIISTSSIIMEKSKIN